MEFQLDDVEVRVLGALLEKEITTPEYCLQSEIEPRAGGVV
jgi:uncharacterized protein YceH (UPF0502 family)